MPDIDWNIYTATQDSPGGPVIIDAPDYDDTVVELPRDENGNLTLGTQIVYSLSLIGMLAFFLYFRFAV